MPGPSRRIAPNTASRCVSLRFCWEAPQDEAAMPGALVRLTRHAVGTAPASTGQTPDGTRSDRPCMVPPVEQQQDGPVQKVRRSG